MKVWREMLPVMKPLREVRLTQYGPALATWERSLQEREHASYERGRQEGERALSEQLIQQRTELHELQNGVLQALAQIMPQVIREAETVLVELALETARKLVSDLPVSVEMVETAVRQTLAQVEETAELKVFLHPDDLALLGQHHSPLLTSAGRETRLQMASSPEVTRGGCLVQTRFGLLDARRETKLRLIREALHS